MNKESKFKNIDRIENGNLVTNGSNENVTRISNRNSYMKRIKVFTVIGLVVLSIGCSKAKKSDSVDVENNITDAVVLGQETENQLPTAGTSKDDSTKAVDISNQPGLIKDQVFDVNLDGFGDVTFAAIEPEAKSGTNSDVRFKLYDQGKEVYTFTGRNEEQSLDTDEFIKVDAVSFTDIDKDGKKDVLAIVEYANTQDNNKKYQEVRVYSQNSEDKAFERMGLIEEYLMKNHYDESIQSMLDGIADYEEYEKSMDGSQSVDAQFGIMEQQKDTWLQEEDFADGGFYYAVTDLDHNGRLELIASNIMGSGVYTYSDYYEINEDFSGLTKWKNDYVEGDSEADITKDTIDSFVDDSMGTEYYIFDDYTKNGAAEFYENKRALTFKDGVIKDIPLAGKSTIYKNEKDFDLTCIDADQNPITEKQYDEIANTVFSDLVKHKVMISWYETQDNNTLKNMNRKELINILSKSYDGFSDETAE